MKFVKCIRYNQSIIITSTQFISLSTNFHMVSIHTILEFSSFFYYKNKKLETVSCLSNISKITKEKFLTDSNTAENRSFPPTVQ